jgi:hypothetical protein
MSWLWRTYKAARASTWRKVYRFVDWLLAPSPATPLVEAVLKTSPQHKKFASETVAYYESIESGRVALTLCLEGEGSFRLDSLRDVNNSILGKVFTGWWPRLPRGWRAQWTPEANGWIVSRGGEKWLYAYFPTAMFFAADSAKLFTALYPLSENGPWPVIECLCSARKGENCTCGGTGDLIGVNVRLPSGVEDTFLLLRPEAFSQEQGLAPSEGAELVFIRKQNKQIVYLWARRGEQFQEYQLEWGRIV